MTRPGAVPRLPPNHRLVHDVVRSQEPGVHASVADIFSRAKTLKPGLGYSTIYRALGRLCGLGLVLELRLPGQGAALYEPARTSHAHFICAGCGRVEDVDCPVPANDIRSVVAARGGKVDDILLTVHGRCAACAAELSDPVR